MTKIYLIRHAEAEGNLYRRLHGQYDSLITGNGRRQLEALERRFEEEPIDACYASDLTRTRITAQALCRPKNLPLHTDARFREICMGVWEDRPFGDLELRDKRLMDLYNSDPQNWQVEGSESYEAFTSRFIAAMTEAAEAHDGQTIAIVTHGGVTRAVLHRLFFSDRPISEVGHSDNTAVSLLEYDGGDYRLIYRNDNSHLDSSISTFACQKWWREGNAADHNLWFRPLGNEGELYIRFREDAWQHVYGTKQGFDGPGFLRDAQATASGDPEALMVAMMGRDEAGFLQLNVHRNEELGAGYIPFFYLREKYRNQGLGVQLIGQAVSYFRPKGRRFLQLSVAPSNETAVHFYERYGFGKVGKTKGRFGGLYLMDKPIELPDWQE